MLKMFRSGYLEEHGLARASVFKWVYKGTVPTEPMRKRIHSFADKHAKLLKKAEKELTIR